MMRRLLLTLLLLAFAAPGQAQFPKAMVGGESGKTLPDQLLLDAVAGYSSAAGLRRWIDVFSADAATIDGTDYSFDGFNLPDATHGGLVDTLFDQDGSDHWVKHDDASRTTLDTLSNGVSVLNVTGTQVLAMPTAFEHLSGTDSVTIFAPALWDSSASTEDYHIFVNGRFPQVSGNMGLFLVQSDCPTCSWGLTTGEPRADIVLEDGSTVRLSTDYGVFGRDNAWEIHEFVVSSDSAHLYNNGRHVTSEATGQVLETYAQWGKEPYFGGNGGRNRGLSGRVFSPLIFPRVLSGAERSQVRDSLSSVLGFSVESNAAPSGDEYTIVGFPDTQQYADGTHTDGVAKMDSAVAWIRRNEAEWNIQLVLHPGDIVNGSAGDATQWDAAEAWFDSLDAEGIPYVLAPGNHDYNTRTSRTATTYDARFPQSRFTALPWWPSAGNFDFYDASAQNWWVRIVPVEGDTLMVFGLEHNTRDDVLDWATDEMAAHPTWKAVVTTHEFITEGGGFEETQTLYDEGSSAAAMRDSLETQEHLFYVHGGHHARGTARRQDQTTTHAHYSLFDPMLEEWGGEGDIRLLVVSPSNRTIRAMTYAPYDDTWRNDFYNLYTLDID